MAVGVINMVTVPVVKVVLVIVIAEIFPVPEEGKPVVPAVADAVHAKVVTATLDVRGTGVVVPPEQMVCVRGVLVTKATGFTMIEKLTGGPWHPLAVGVTVNVTV